MKPFADWVQEIAEANNHEPEPERVTGWDHAAPGTSDHGARPQAHRPMFADEDDTDLHIACSGAGCGQFGAPNYSSVSGDEADEYWCGGSYRCCP